EIRPLHTVQSAHRFIAHFGEPIFSSGRLHRFERPAKALLIEPPRPVDIVRHQLVPIEVAVLCHRASPGHCGALIVHRAPPLRSSSAEAFRLACAAFGAQSTVRGCDMAPMKRLAGVFLLALTIPASAADPVFPPGSRVGLVPPEGFVAGKAYPGFENRDKNGIVLITELPASAYSDLEEHIADQQLQRQGVTVEKREPMTLATGPGFLVIGRQEA